MGLDWCLNVRARPGSEARLKEINARLYQLRTEGEVATPSVAALWDEREKLIQSPYEYLGCPRVGTDQEALDWLKADYENDPASYAGRDPDADPPFSAMEPTPSWETVLRRYQDVYIIQLAKNTAGIPAVIGGSAGMLDFRGQVVADCDEILSTQLRDAAYSDRDPAQMLQYAKDLRAELDEALADEATLDVAEEHKYYLQHAIRWLEFWGNAGFDMHAWY